ncbi:hypothetical protein [Aquimarina mytili]|uniref:Uncharacterized protein n=1 Tax=Aquimarina mytili TaxID=874423 RepID=A0A937DBU5_9FLAO|nr:hypothetical protein [Aquimarina mytili]MBL0686097.1 hypothetical protein [Aquimarina mytili]
MNNTISTESVKNLTGIEIIHYFSLWLYNWTQDDFKEAFKESRLGWDYFWDKLQARSNPKSDNPDNPTNALVGIVLNMDKTHQQMLFDYIFNKGYVANIEKQRKNNAWMEEQLQEHYKKHGINK